MVSNISTTEYMTVTTAQVQLYRYYEYTKQLLQSAELMENHK